MNRKEFIDELKARLKRLPPDEIDNALNFYEEYFDDAGIENLSETISALGSPASVASKIIGEYAINEASADAAKSEGSGKSGGAGKTASSAPTDESEGSDWVSAKYYGKKDQSPDANGQSAESRGRSSESRGRSADDSPYGTHRSSKRARGGKGMSTFLIVLLAIFASPIALPIGISIIALIISLGAVMLSLTVAGGSIFIVGAACAIASLWVFTQSFATGLMYLGAGMFLLALGLVSVSAMIKASKGLFRGLQKWLGRLLIKRGAK